MKTFITILSAIAMIALSVVAFNVSAATDVLACLPVMADMDYLSGSGSWLMAGAVGSTETVMRMLDGVEKSLTDFQMQAKRDLEDTKKVSTETKNALDAIGMKQRELADEILLIKQKAVAKGDNASNVNRGSGWGSQIVKNTAFVELSRGDRNKARFEIANNTITSTTTTVGADHRPGVIPGAFTPLNLESLFKHIPTVSNMIEYTRENVFTNSAAETADSIDTPESSITFTLVQQPVSTVSHWLKISKQLAADHAALVEYINARLSWGVQRKVDAQIAAGNGIAPNMSGLLQSGNFVPHGYTAAQVGTPLAKHRLIRRVISDMRAGGYAPNAILLNPADWLAFDLDLLSSTPAALSSSDIANGFMPMLFGVPVVESGSITADTFAVVDTFAAASVYDRQDVLVEMSDSDDDNFTKGLITVKATRRLALAIEQVGAIRGGDLSPA
jgi:HK97 family phage major capsid protein